MKIKHPINVKQEVVAAAIFTPGVIQVVCIALA